ncbi:predicted protein [Aspergillus terreus NIH2624]|uniref:Uncharacterized protein n=1 Tax=Aspergillus terreus (strain NIH 2624 / FGSC A1156) TaxID=341663 RepID=Q0CLU7_ASPTN|nr:uncharacterized protein ATEG_05337 [Aspergillus terreus NIH2624]EAU34406.1 predicted protein [Aspergillus terreus NIH2624]
MAAPQGSQQGTVGNVAGGSEEAPHLSSRALSERQPDPTHLRPSTNPHIILQISRRAGCMPQFETKVARSSSTLPRPRQRASETPFPQPTTCRGARKSLRPSGCHWPSAPALLSLTQTNAWDMDRDLRVIGALDCLHRYNDAGGAPRQTSNDRSGANTAYIGLSDTKK